MLHLHEQWHSVEQDAGNPADALRGVIPPVKSKHLAGLTDPNEVGGLMRSIHGYLGEPSVRAALLSLAYTFLRQGEIRTMRWSDVDFENATVRIPAARMKIKRDLSVPLANQMISLLCLQHNWSGNSELVFPGLISGRPISENTLGAALWRLGYSSERHVPHGFRITASTLLNEDGWNRDWIEHQLAHVERDSVRRAYNAAEYLEGRRKMMQAWANKLDGLTKANV